MNYERALATLHHAGTGKRLAKKRLGNATWLHYVVQPRGHDTIELELFGKRICAWYKNGGIGLDNHGFWRRTTLDRFNKYMPVGFRVWQARPFWYVGTPSGTLPYHNGVFLDASGRSEALGPLNQRDAVELRRQVGAYAKLYAQRLVRGDIPQDAAQDCPECRRYYRILGTAYQERMAHLLTHLERGDTPACLITTAFQGMGRMQLNVLFEKRSARKMTRGFLHEVIKASWTENQVLWRTPKSRAALIARTEAILQADNPRFDIFPSKWVTNLRMLVEEYLLYALRFERMQE